MMTCLMMTKVLVPAEVQQLGDLLVRDPGLNSFERVKGRVFPWSGARI